MVCFFAIITVLAEICVHSDSQNSSSSFWKGLEIKSCLVTPGFILGGGGFIPKTLKS